MKNNRDGQVLVAFVLLIPVFLMIIAMVSDVGNLYAEKSKTDNIIKNTIKYGLKNIDDDSNELENKMIKLINENLDNIKNLDISISDDSIFIEITRNKASMFFNIFKDANYKIVTSYEGTIEEDVIEIRKGS